MPEGLLVDLQILLQMLLFLLFLAVSRLMTAWDFMRWWTWAWGAMAALLLLFRLSFIPGMPAFYSVEIYPRLSPLVASLQVVLFLLGAVSLRWGREAAARLRLPLILAFVVLGVTVGILGPAMYDDASLQFASRAALRSFGLAIVFPLCAYAFWRALSAGRGVLFLIAPAGFLLYGMNQAVYFSGFLAHLLGEGWGIATFEGLGLEIAFSTYGTFSDLAWTAAIGLGTVVVLMSEAGRVKDALEESEHRFREVFQQAPTGMALIDTSDRIVGTNQALRRLIGREQAVLEGVLFHELAHPDDRDRVRELLHAARSDGPAGAERGPIVDRPVRYRREGGGIVQADTSLVAAESEADERRELIVQLHDVTEKRALERHLRQSQKAEALRSLAAGMAHDFNNLFHVVSMNAHLMALDLPEDSPWREGLDEVGAAVSKGRAITDQILASAGEVPFERSHLDLRTFFIEVEDFLRASLPELASLEIECHGSVAVIGNSERLVQVFSHLLSNAGDALGEGGGAVTIRAEAVEMAALPEEGSFLPKAPTPGRWVQLTVSDTGHGMGPDTLRRIYDPFFTTHFVGRGLGLPAVLGIVAAHEGAVAVESREGEGTTVTILLPPHPD